jgi:hypothetical protein
MCVITNARLSGPLPLINDLFMIWWPASLILSRCNCSGDRIYGSRYYSCCCSSIFPHWSNCWNKLRATSQISQQYRYQAVPAEARTSSIDTRSNTNNYAATDQNELDSTRPPFLPPATNQSMPQPFEQPNSDVFMFHPADLDPFFTDDNAWADIMSNTVFNTQNNVILA